MYRYNAYTNSNDMAIIIHMRERSCIYYYTCTHNRFTCMYVHKWCGNQTELQLTDTASCDCSNGRLSIFGDSTGLHHPNTLHITQDIATCTCVVGSSPTRSSSFFLGKVTALGVLCCFALFVCLTLLVSFFLPSHLSFKNMYIHNALPVYEEQ